MKKIHLTIGTLISTFLAISQETVSLKPPVELDTQKFYIENVLDDRQEPRIGVFENSSGREIDLILNGGASLAIKRFTDLAIPKKMGNTPITIRIKSLEIQQAQTGIDEITTRAYIRLSFCSGAELQHGELFNVNRYEEEVFTIGEHLKIRETHEKRIRSALEYCILSFQSFFNKNGSDSNKGNEIISHSGSSSLENRTPLGKWYDLLTFKRMFNRYDNGWEVSYLGFADSNSKFIVPFEISYGQLTAKSDFLKSKGYDSLDSYSLGGGFNGLLKIVPGLYLNLGVNMPLGVEILRGLDNKRSHNFLIGIGASQGIKVIPWKNFGLVVGIGVSEMIQTSKIYKSNLGWEIEFGINL
ncbi:hypothetical protein LV716_10915 [Flagellimonas sp. HMM57]|uniref:hypothetical protein n=1 Tax=unclassified Flagellimonas TaxID=2644544 RepID=UPI0013D25283|nr:MULTISPECIES: hypothetical protein [unclassified Flagellimonas]UII74775.1 hypothetical protein LV716_10915 [Flagellimonas sp. HMM57]